MWGKKTSAKKVTGHFDTLISSQTSVHGDMQFTGGLHIDGKVQGTLRADESGEAVVRISDVGEVDGDVVAPHIIVNGTVHGDVYASKHIELASKASIKGNVYYSLIEMAMGAEVNGKLVHHQDPGELPAEMKKKFGTDSFDKAVSQPDRPVPVKKPTVVATDKKPEEKDVKSAKAQ